MQTFLEVLQAMIAKLAAVWFAPKAVRDYVAILVLFVGVLAFEFITSRDWRRYRSARFRTDVLYFAFTYSGALNFLIWAPLYRLLLQRIHPLRPTLLDLMPSAVLRVAVFILLADFLEYWIHRWKHTNSILWAFHRIHHSQRDLTVFANYRIHFADELVRRMVFFFAFLAMGSDARIWAWCDVAINWLLLLQHSGFKWDYGPFGWVVSSPRFHGVHHSIDTRDHNRNFGILFPFWDRLFGTARPRSAVATAFGLDREYPESFFKQLWIPFRELADKFQGREKAVTAMPVHE